MRSRSTADPAAASCCSWRAWPASQGRRGRTEAASAQQRRTTTHRHHRRRRYRATDAMRREETEAPGTTSDAASASARSAWRRHSGLVTVHSSSTVHTRRPLWRTQHVVSTRRIVASALSVVPCSVALQTRQQHSRFSAEASDRTGLLPNQPSKAKREKKTAEQIPSSHHTSLPAWTISYRAWGSDTSRPPRAATTASRCTLALRSSAQARTSLCSSLRLPLPAHPCLPLSLRLPAWCLRRPALLWVRSM